MEMKVGKPCDKTPKGERGMVARNPVVSNLVPGLLWFEMGSHEAQTILQIPLQLRVTLNS